MKDSPKFPASFLTVMFHFFPSETLRQRVIVGTRHYDALIAASYIGMAPTPVCKSPLAKPGGMQFYSEVLLLFAAAVAALPQRAPAAGCTAYEISKPRSTR